MLDLQQWFGSGIKRDRLPARNRRRSLRMETLESRELLASVTGAIQSIGDPGYGPYATEIAGDIAVDAAGNTFIAGFLEDTIVDFDPHNAHPGDVDIVNADLTSSDDAATFFAKYNADGSLAWVQSVSPLNMDFLRLATDAAGNLYIAGSFMGASRSFGSTTLTGVENGEVLIAAKLDAGDGTFEWATKIDSGRDQYGTQDLVVTPTGDALYLTGSANGFGSVEFVAKANASGAVWMRTMPQSLNVNALAVDSGGNVYSTGSFSGSLDFNPGPGKAILSSGSGQSARPSAFVWKLDASGNYVWAKSFAAGNNSASFGEGIALEANGNLIVAGQFRGSVDFNPAKATLTLPNAGSNDVFLVRMNSAGSVLGGTSFGGAGNDTVGDLQLDASGNIYLSGAFSNYSTEGIDFAPGTATVTRTGNGSYVLKLDSNFGFQWVATLTGNDPHFGLAMAVDSTNQKVQLALTIISISSDLNLDPDPDPENPEVPGGSEWDIYWLTLLED